MKSTPKVANVKSIPSMEELLDKVQITISNAWNNGYRIHKPNIDKWLDNFTGEALCTPDDESLMASAAEREKELALFLLCNFVYYNEDEIKHMVKLMFDRYAHNVFTSEGKSAVDNDEFTELIDKTQFTYIGNVSESSSFLLYHFRQENDLSKQCFAENEKTENIVFVDDFSITGGQAKSYIKKIMKRSDWKAERKAFLLLMVTTEKAIKELKNITGVTIIPCIVLNDKSKAFSTTSTIFSGYNDIYKAEAKRMCEYYGEKIMPNSKGMTALGYRGGEYLFGAYYNIPDNTLPIFWSSQNGWNYLFKRYDKIYGVSGMSLGGRYV